MTNGSGFFSQPEVLSAHAAFTADRLDSVYSTLRECAVERIGSIDATEREDARLPLESALTDLQHITKEVRYGTQSLHAGRLVSHGVYLEATRMVQQIILSMSLRDRGKLKRVLCNAVRAMLPHCDSHNVPPVTHVSKSQCSSCNTCVNAGMQASMRDIWREDQVAVASATTLQRGRFFLDVAMLQATRAARLENPSLLNGVRVGWADSSPQLGADWLLMLSQHVPEDKVVSVFHASLALARRNDSGHAMDEDTMDEHEETLRTSITMSAHIPVGLGSGETSLAHKASALVHAHMLECPDLVATETMLGSYYAYCTDMGVEMGLSSFCSQSLSACLPKYFQQGNVCCPSAPTLGTPQSHEKTLHCNVLFTRGLCNLSLFQTPFGNM
eukprot:6492726-Amphidinium_carterae.1